MTDFLLVIFTMYFGGGIVFLTYQTAKARQKVKRVEKEISEITHDSKEAMALRAIKRHTIRKEKNLLQATWKEKIIITIAWTYILETKRA